MMSLVLEGWGPGQDYELRKIFELEKWMFLQNSLPTTLHCSGVADKKALCVCITLMRVDEMQVS